MYILIDAVNLLTTPPGGLVYHLIVLFAIEAILGIALGQWQRDRKDRAAGRLSVAAGLLLLSRLVLMGMALLSWQGVITTAEIVPPLERCLDTVTLILLCWTFALWDTGNEWISRLFLVAGLLGTLVVYVVFAFLWSSELATEPTLTYNGHWQDLAWTLAQLALIGLAAILLLWRRAGQWGLVLIAFGIMGLGLLLHLVVPYTSLSTDLPHTAGWVRPANLIAFPLLAIAVYRDVVRGLRRRTQTLEDIRQESLSQITGLLFLLETSQRMSSSLDLNTVVDDAVRGVAGVLNSNLCGLAILPEGQSEVLQLAGVYATSDQVKAPAAELHFPISDYPAIEHAIRRRKQVIIENGIDSPQVRDLYHLLGSEETGPLLVQPLLGAKSLVGVIIVGNAGARRPFSTTDGKLCQTLAKQIAIALENARLYRKVAHRAEQLSQEIREQEADSTAHKSALEVELQRTKEDLELFTQRLYELENQLRESRAQIKELTTQLQEEEEDHQQKQAVWQSDVQRVQEEAARLTTHLIDLQQEHTALEEQYEQLRRERDALAEQLQELRRKEAAAPLPTDLAPLESLSGGLLLTNAQGEIVWANAMAAQLLAQSRDVLSGRSLGEVVTVERWRRAVERAQQGSSAELDFSVEERTVRAYLSPVLTAEGQFNGVVVLLLDVSAEEQRRRDKDTFLASLAHELRTPMTSITGYTDLLLSDAVGVVGEMQRNFLQRVKANVERMEVMLNNLIGVTAIDTGQLQIELEPIDVRAVVEDTITGAQAQLEEKGLTLKLNLPRRIPTLYADPECVRQIMVNLLSNACKASREGGEVHIRGEVHNEAQEGIDVAAPFLLISVTDSGEGIAPEDLPRVFDRFYQADHPLIKGLGETGVGLAVVKTMVEAHQGQVWVESQVGQGTTFSVALPLSPVVTV
ncbi:MAG: GAF domain-containing protein [Anaerolineae bacterium]|nr:GAF domain-containing protein [Anaerolineae bacterium]